MDLQLIEILVMSIILTLKCAVYHICDAVLNFFILNEEGIIEKISYERRAYESVDGKSLSYVMSRKMTKKNHAYKG